MARTLSDLANELDKLANDLPLQVLNTLSKECAEVVLTDLLQVTPVDTSKALSNWQVSLDVPVTSLLPAYYPGFQGSTQLVSQQAALETAQAILAQKQPGQTIYIGNALPYIQRLNEGWSAQTPAGFVERAVLLGRLFSENPTSFGKV